MYGFYIALIIILVISFITGNIILYYEHKHKDESVIRLQEDKEKEIIEEEDQGYEETTEKVEEPLEKIQIHKLDSIDTSSQEDQSSVETLIIDEEVI